VRGFRRRFRRAAERRRGARMAFAGSVTLHTVAAGVFLTSTSVHVAMPPVYRVELVAAPRPEPNRRRAPETVQRQAEQTVPMRRPPRRTSQAETQPPPVQQPEELEPAPRTEAVELAPNVEPSTGSDPATVSTAGVEFPFPEYLRNIVVQVHRRWQKP